MNQQEMIQLGVLLGICLFSGIFCLLGRKNKCLLHLIGNGILSVGLLFGMERVSIPFFNKDWLLPQSPENIGICFVLGFPGLMLLYGMKIFKR